MTNKILTAIHLLVESITTLDLQYLDAVVMTGVRF